MQDEKKIQALIAANAPENQKIAMELMQSQWGFNMEKVYSYILDFYCNTNNKEFFLYLKDKTISYSVNYHREPETEWYIFLTFKMEQDNILKEEEPFIVTYIGENDEDKNLKDYASYIKTHFENLLPNILELENS